MALIDDSYFVGSINIPNVDRFINSFNDRLEEYEKEVLIDLLGYQLYNDFILGISEVTPEQRWLDLRDGGVEFTFTFDGHEVTRKWDGLINDEQKSLIAYYSYYRFIYESQSSTSGIGEVIGNAENSTRVDNIRKSVSAWNEFLRLYGDTCNYYFSKFNETYYTFNDEPSAYNFLNANRDVYTNWEFSTKRRLNTFGI